MDGNSIVTIEAQSIGNMVNTFEQYRPQVVFCRNVIRHTAFRTSEFTCAMHGSICAVMIVVVSAILLLHMLNVPQTCPQIRTL